MRTFAKASSSLLFWFILYLVAHALIRVFLSETIQVDDREQIIHALSLDYGYRMPQPPLYSWLSFFFFELFGISISTLTTLKYILLFFTGYFILRISDKIHKRKQNQGLVLMSFLLMPSFFWHMHMGFTHTILLGLSIVLTFYSLILLSENSSVKNYLFLGLAISLGFYSKYSYAIFFLLLATSVFIAKPFRRIILDKKIIISLIIFLLTYSPHLLWLIDNLQGIVQMMDNRLQVNKFEINFITNVANIFLSLLGFIFPLIIFYSFGFRKIYKGIIEKPKNSFLSLLNNFYLILLFIIIVASALHSFPEVKVRWLHPVMMLFPFWFFLLIEELNYKFTKNSIKFFYTLIFVVNLFVFGVRIIQNTIGPGLGHISRLNIPYAELLKKIPRGFLDKSDFIFTKDFDLFAHSLTSLDKKTEISAIGAPNYFTRSPNFKNCLILSKTKTKDNIEIRQKVGSKDFSIYYEIKEIKNCN